MTWRRVRLACGLVMFTYLALHFLMHALGLWSFDAMQWGTHVHEPCGTARPARGRCTARSRSTSRSGCMRCTRGAASAWARPSCAADPRFSIVLLAHHFASGRYAWSALGVDTRYDVLLPALLAPARASLRVGATLVGVRRRQPLRRVAAGVFFVGAAVGMGAGHGDARHVVARLPRHPPVAARAHVVSARGADAPRARGAVADVRAPRIVRGHARDPRAHACRDVVVWRRLRLRRRVRRVRQRRRARRPARWSRRSTGRTRCSSRRCSPRAACAGRRSGGAASSASRIPAAARSRVPVGYRRARGEPQRAHPARVDLRRARPLHDVPRARAARRRVAAAARALGADRARATARRAATCGSRASSGRTPTSP